MLDELDATGRPWMDRLDVQSTRSIVSTLCFSSQTLQHSDVPLADGVKYTCRSGCGDTPSWSGSRGRCTSRTAACPWQAVPLYANTPSSQISAVGIPCGSGQYPGVQVVSLDTMILPLVAQRLCLLLRTHTHSSYCTYFECRHNVLLCIIKRLLPDPVTVSYVRGSLIGTL